MKKKIFGSTLVLIILATVAPGQADVVGDQSRLSVSSPLSPSLEQVMCPPGKRLLLNERRRREGR